MIKLKTYSDNERIGRLDRRITFWSYATIQNDYGEEVITWQDLAEVWANVDYKNGKEDEESERLTAFTKVLFTVRYDSRFLDKKLQIVFEGKDHDINGTNVLGRKEYISLICELKE